MGKTQVLVFQISKYAGIVHQGSIHCSWNRHCSKEVKYVAVVLISERRTKTRSGAGVHHYRKVTPKMFQQTGNVFCPVDMYKKYRGHRPPDLLTPESRFYLQNLPKPSGNVWFSHQPVGKDKLGKMMNVLAEKGSLEGRKTNHSTRKTFVTTLIHAGRPPTEVAHLAGWKNVQTVDENSVPSIENSKQNSRTLLPLIWTKKKVLKTLPSVTPRMRNRRALVIHLLCCVGPTSTEERLTLLFIPGTKSSSAFPKKIRLIYHIHFIKKGSRSNSNVIN